MDSAVLRDQRLRWTRALSIGVLALVLAGCAGGADAPAAEPVESEAQTAAEDETTDGDVADGAAGGGDLGTITVGTTVYEVVETVNCEPVSGSDVVDRVLEVIAVGQSVGGDEALLFAYTDEQSGVAGNFVDYQGPEGTWSTREDNATFVLESGSLSGAGTLIDDADTQSMMVQFDFAVPAELVQC